MALVVGAVFALPAAPAMAAPPEVQITSLSTASLASGQRAALKYSVKNTGDLLPPGQTSADITVSFTFGEIKCEGDCNLTATIEPGQTKEFNATLIAGNVAAGQTKSGQLIIEAKTGGDRGTAKRDISVRGPDQVQTVKEISGKVKNQLDGSPVAGALVAISDSQNHRYEVTTGSTGNFRFVGSEQRPITPGPIQIGAMKEDASNTKTINAGPGQSVPVQLTLKLAAAAPSPTVEATVEATVDPGVEDTAEATTDASQAAAPTGNEDSGGSGSLLLILLGGLLVALGVGAIVLLLVRRKDGDEEDEDGAASPAAAPGRRGGYADDATRVTSPAGMGGADPTMLAHPSLADAPTMMHNRPLVDDEFPDPYGAPMPPRGPQPPSYGQPGRADDGYGAPTQVGYGASGYGNGPTSGSGYGNAPASGGGYGGPGNGPTSGSGYGNGPTSGGGYGGPGNRPSSGGGYGTYGAAPSSGGGYGGPTRADDGYGTRDYGPPTPGYGGGYERYDEPTGRYDGPASRYDEPTGRYDGGVGGFDQPPYQAEYGQGSGGGRGYDQSGYGDRPGRDGGYGRGDYGPGDGYEQPQGYDRPGDGYDTRGGYDRVPEQREGGYDQGGYYGDPAQDGGRRGAPQQPTRAERRSLDWLDD